MAAEDNRSNDNVECVLRNGHCEGHTDFTFIADGRKLMTCGLDMEVRVWPSDDNDDQQSTDDNTSFTIADTAYAIVANSTEFFIACDSNSVKSYAMADGENETTVCRFTTNATHLDISADGKWLAASAADFTLKLINLETKDQTCFEGHAAPVLSVALDPKRQFIASSSCDGSVRVWNAETKTCVHYWSDCFPKSNDFENSKTLGRVCWEPTSGHLIAVPHIDRVDVHRRDTWDLVTTYRHNRLDEVSIATYSSDGKYMAVGTSDGVVMIWDTVSANAEPIAKFFHNKSLRITALKWMPKSSTQLCFCDINGQFGVLTVNRLAKTTGSNVVLSQTEMSEMFADLSDDDFGEDITENMLTKKPKPKSDLELPKIKFNPEFEQTIEDRMESAVNATDGDIMDDDFDNDNEFDIGAIKSRYESQIFGETSDTAATKASDGRRPDSRISERAVPLVAQEVEEAEPLPFRQEPFQSGSTPINFEQRFMVWNSVGIVLCYNTDAENSVTVEFHDVSHHHSIHLPNTQNYTMCDLTADALVLATNGDESATSGKLFCMLLNIWDATKEWQIEMNKDEYIDAIACGTGFIAVATDQRFVRILTTGGIQTSIFSIAGRVVCLSAFEQFLLIIYHSGSGVPEEQSMSLQVLRVQHRPTSKHPVPNPIAVALSPKSEVSWAGFTDEGTPCVADLDGIVRIFTTGVGNTWVPIASTKDNAKGKSDNFFIIGLSEIQNQIRCIFCKGSRYPATVPKPSVTLLPLQLPLCEMFTAKGKHEEEHIRNQMLSSLLKKLSKDGFDVDSNLEECNRNIINSLIKLFAMALGADREALAVEISHLMPNKRAVEGAIKFAERQKRRTLAQKLSEIAEQKLVEELNELSDDEEEVEVIDEPNPRMASNSRIPSIEDRTAGFQLKPKAMRRGGDAQDVESDDSESIIDVKSATKTDTNDDDNCITDDDNDSNSVSLKPRVMNVTKQQMKGNPFKVTQNQRKTKRKQNSSDESDGDDEDGDDRSGDGRAFGHYYAAMKHIIKDDNSDVESETEVKQIARDRFRELDAAERKGWATGAGDGKGGRKRQRKAKPDINATNKENTKNKITNFFTKN